MRNSLGLRHQRDAGVQLVPFWRTNWGSAQPTWIQFHVYHLSPNLVVHTKGLNIRRLAQPDWLVRRIILMGTSWCWPAAIIKQTHWISVSRANQYTWKLDSRMRDNNQDTRNNPAYPPKKKKKKVKRKKPHEINCYSYEKYICSSFPKRLNGERGIHKW